MSAIYSNISFRSMQSGIQAMKSRLEKLQHEITTGRQSAPAIKLGGQSGPLFAMRQQATTVQAYRDNITASQLALRNADLSLADVSKSADEAQTLILQFRSGTLTKDQLGEAVGRLLETFSDAFAQGTGGLNPLSGQSGRLAPISPYFSNPPSIAQADYHSAFLANFGFAIDDPLASTLTGAQLASFAEGIKAGYSDPLIWEQTWLAGPVASLEVPVSSSWRASSPTVASIDGVKGLAASLVNLVELSSADVSDEAFGTAVETVTAQLGVAAKSLQDSRARIGWQQAKLIALDETYQTRQSRIDAALSSLEGIDQYAAVSELNDLKSQLEISYTITSKLQDLFLARYIS